MPSVWAIETADGAVVAVATDPGVLPQLRDGELIVERQTDQVTGWLADWQNWAWRIQQQLGMERSADADVRDLFEGAIHFGYRMRSTTDAMERLATMLVETNNDHYVRQAADTAEQLAAVEGVLAGTLGAVEVGDPRWSKALVLAVKLRADLVIAHGGALPAVRAEIALDRLEQAVEALTVPDHDAIQQLRTAFRMFVAVAGPTIEVLPGFDRLRDAFAMLACPECHQTRWQHKMSCSERHQ